MPSVKVKLPEISHENGILSRAHGVNFTSETQEFLSGYKELGEQIKTRAPALPNGHSSHRLKTTGY